jgi:hypothetical protein
MESGQAAGVSNSTTSPTFLAGTGSLLVASVATTQRISPLSSSVLRRYHHLE